MPDSPARNKLYVEMAKVIEAYAPWRLDISRYRNMLAQPWVLGFKKHPILHAEWQYIDVAPEKVSEALRTPSEMTPIHGLPGIGVSCGPGGGSR